MRKLIWRKILKSKGYTKNSGLYGTKYYKNGNIKVYSQQRTYYGNKIYNSGEKTLKFIKNMENIINNEL